MTEVRGRVGGITAVLGEREALERLELLASVSYILAQAIEDYHKPIEATADLCVPDFCDLCAVEVINPDGEAHVVAYRVARASGLSAPKRWTPVGRDCALDRQAVLSYPGPAEPGPARAVRERIGAESLIVAPIIAGGITIGSVVVATGPQRRGFRPSATRVVADLGMRLGTMIQRVLLHRETRAAAQKEAQTARRLRRLAATAANLAGADTTENILRVACIEACGILDADGASARWVMDDGTEIEASAGPIDTALSDKALAAVARNRPARGPGWLAFPLPCGSSEQWAALAIFMAREPTAEDEVVMSSLAAIVPVAFERAVGTEAAVLHEARLRAMVEALPVAVIAFQRDGTATLTNAAADQLLGSACENQPIPEPLRPALLQLVDDATSAGVISDRALVVDRFDLSVSAAPMPAVVGSEPAVLVAAIDMSERRAVERGLLQAQRLEAMGQVAGGVAHDFNNVLTVISGYVELLQRTVEDETALAMVASIDKAARRASGLTQQLLGFTRHHLENPIVVDLGEAVGNLLSVIERLAGPSIEIHFETKHHPLNVLADPSELEQIILNLVINARDAMNGKGSLWLCTHKVDLGESAAELSLRPGSYARLTVIDTGMGMSEEVRSRCLEPFFTTKERGKGSGLGLPTVYGLATERGGTMEIMSSEGSGTTVQVWLPYCAASQPGPSAESPVAARRSASRSGRVLLVEDEDELRTLATGALSEAGLEVLSVAGAEAALEVLGDEQVDAVVTDIVLPGMSGVELSERLRSRQPKLPVLFVSGYADRETRRRGLGERAQLLRKPYRLSELCDRVTALLDEAQGSNL